jgi:GDP-4-dehydro-6-deoxy-D-mannose reductase
MRVLVTGANGFAGRHLAFELREAGYEVIGLGRARGPAIQVVADIENPAALHSALRDSDPDACIHLAGLASPPDADHDPVHAFRVNTMGVIHLLDAFAATGKDARILIVTSSQVYGFHDCSETIPETAPLQPHNIYALTKTSADQLALHYARSESMQVMICRPTNHFGPGQSDRFVASAFARQLVDIERGVAEPLLRIGNLESRRDFLDVRDVVRAYRLILEQGAPAEAYNIGSGKLTGIRTLLDQLCRISGVDPDRKQDPGRYRPADDGPVLDTKKIHNATGWKPEIPLEQTLRDTLEYFRNQNTT